MTWTLDPDRRLNSPATHSPAVRLFVEDDRLHSLRRHTRRRRLRRCRRGTISGMGAEGDLVLLRRSWENSTASSGRAQRYACIPTSAWCGTECSPTSPRSAGHKDGWVCHKFKGKVRPMASRARDQADSAVGRSPVGGSAPAPSPSPRARSGGLEQPAKELPQGQDRRRLDRRPVRSVRLPANGRKRAWASRCSTLPGSGVGKFKAVQQWRAFISATWNQADGSGSGSGYRVGLVGRRWRAGGLFVKMTERGGTEPRGRGTRGRIPPTGAAANWVANRSRPPKITSIVLVDGLKIGRMLEKQEKWGQKKLCALCRKL